MTDQPRIQRIGNYTRRYTPKPKRFAALVARQTKQAIPAISYATWLDRRRRVIASSLACHEAVKRALKALHKLEMRRQAQARRITTNLCETD
jgi:hypothetical protein